MFKNFVKKSHVVQTKCPIVLYNHAKNWEILGAVLKKRPKSSKNGYLIPYNTGLIIFRKKTGSNDAPHCLLQSCKKMRRFFELWMLLGSTWWLDQKNRQQISINQRRKCRVNLTYCKFFIVCFLIKGILRKKVICEVS